MVDDGLISSAETFGVLVSGLDHFIIKHDGYAGFSFAVRNGTPLGRAEVIFFFHKLSLGTAQFIFEAIRAPMAALHRTIESLMIPRRWALIRFEICPCRP